jgi:hypothetical protein
MTLIVVGSAPCLHDDLARALELRPFASVMLVNGACSAVEHAEHVLAGHTDKAELFQAARLQAFPKAPAWRLHATTDQKNIAVHKSTYPSVTDWHWKDMCTGATSAGKAIRIGFKLGFDEVILCGCPMDGSGYAPQEAKMRHDGRRVGDGSVQEHRVIQGYKRNFKELAASEWFGKVFSMSGFTKQCLGSP